MTRLRPLSEAECYTRCYGTRGDSVTIVRREPRPVRGRSSVSGEYLRSLFEARLDSRDPEQMAEPAEAA